jgi:hypothetical protein
MQKIVINKCYGGFSLSKKALHFIGIPMNHSGSYYNMPRDDKALVYCVETLGESANGSFAELKVVEIPDGVEWEIEGYDGVEWISEVHRTWR